jgi:hypothetical protein
MPARGGDAFPVGYGDWDQTNPRWSPDGTRVAFISNQQGNTHIDIERIPGGDIQALEIGDRHYQSPMGRLHLEVKDRDGRAASARISVTDAAGRFYAPANAWMHGDDGFDRSQRTGEAHYFHMHGDAWVDVPAGTISAEILHGLERKLEQRRVAITAGQAAALAVDIDEELDRARTGVSADVHVHNY